RPLIVRDGSDGGHRWLAISGPHRPGGGRSPVGVLRSAIVRNGRALAPRNVVTPIRNGAAPASARIPLGFVSACRSGPSWLTRTLLGPNHVSPSVLIRKHRCRSMLCRLRIYRIPTDQQSEPGDAAGSENPGLRSVELGLGEEVRIRCLTWPRVAA